MPVSKEKQEELDARRQLVARFLERGLSIWVVAELIGCKSGDVTNDRKALNIPPQSRVGMDQALLDLLIFWMQLMSSGSREEDLLEILERHHEVARFRGFIEGLIAQYEIMCTYPKLEGGYQKLFEALFGEQQINVPCIRDVFFEVVRDQLRLDRMESVADLRAHILQVFRDRFVDISSVVTRFEPHDIMQRLDTAIETLEGREGEIIIRRFGMKGHKASTLEELGEELDLTRERIRQIEQEALESLRRFPCVRNILCRVIETVKSFQSTRKQLEAENRRLQERIITIEVVDIPRRRELDRSVDEFQFSARSANCLGRAQIDWIGQLVQKTEKELLEIRSFGQKSLCEIKEVLASLGLTLGMSFPEWSPPKVPHQRASTSDPYPHL